MKKEEGINYFETFVFPDIENQKYPVYSVSESGHVFNLKSIIYPNSKSTKKFTRRKQLVHRSLQAKIFDAFVFVGYFEPLKVVREFPIIIQNRLRIPGLTGGYFLLDYYFPQLRLCVELDSDLHNDKKDDLRDAYLKQLGITVFRIRNFERADVQQGKRFHELTKILRETTIDPNPVEFCFSDNIWEAIGKQQKNNSDFLTIE